VATIGIYRVETIDPLAEIAPQETETALIIGIRPITGTTDLIEIIGTIAQADRDKTVITDGTLDQTGDKIVAETVAEDLV